MRKRLLTAALTLALLSAPALADNNNLPGGKVAKMAGQKRVSRAQPGEYVQGLNGQWLRK